MKNEIRRYFPAFFDVDESDCVVIPFETLEELLKIPFVSIWATLPGFHKYALSSSSPSTAPEAKRQHNLMAQLKEGYEWWVIGILKHSVEGLPEHVPLYREEKVLVK